MWDEMLPGDTINLKQSSFFKLLPAVTPIMDELTMETQYFFVPYRIIFDQYPAMMGEQINEGDSTTFVLPTVEIAGGPTRFIYMAQYLGVPLNAIDVVVSALPFRAHNKIYNHWYRDPNLQDAIPENQGLGPDLEADYANRRRGKKKDLITGCLPWPQRGDPINLLFDGVLPVTPVSPAVPIDIDYGTQWTGGHWGWDQGASVMTILGGSGTLTADQQVLWKDSGLEVDLAAGNPITINSMRNSFQVQRLLERDARGGARLTEILQAHFKVISPDARLNRPEYIGGTSTLMGMQTVTSTNAGNAATFGEQAGNGVGYGESNSMMYSATEHGIIMGICSIRAPITYQQGLARKFTRSDRFDHFWPAFSHLGEQPIRNDEVYCQGPSGGSDDTDVWGYNEAWAQYRTNQDLVTGQLSSEATVPLDSWHLAEDISSLPVLNDSFIQDQTQEAVNRSQTVSSTIQYICEFHFKIKHTRPLPTFSTPGLIDHF